MADQRNRRAEPSRHAKERTSDPDDSAGAALSRDFRALARKHHLQSLLAVVADERGLHSITVATEPRVALELDRAIGAAVQGVHRAGQTIVQDLLEQLLADLLAGICEIPLARSPQLPPT